MEFAVHHASFRYKTLSSSVRDNDLNAVEHLASSPFWWKSQKGGEAFRLAAELGHTEIVRALLDKGAVVDDMDGRGRTALYWASWAGHSAVVSLLLEAGAAVDKKGKEGRTALYLASLGGNAPIVKVLLDAGATVDIQNDYGNTALHQACRNGYTEIVKLLLDDGADVSKLNRDGLAPADLATTDQIKAMLRPSAQSHNSDLDYVGYLESLQTISSSSKGKRRSSSLGRKLSSLSSEFSAYKKERDASRQKRRASHEKLKASHEQLKAELAATRSFSSRGRGRGGRGRGRGGGRGGMGSPTPNPPPAIDIQAEVARLVAEELSKAQLEAPTDLGSSTPSHSRSRRKSSAQRSRSSPQPPAPPAPGGLTPLKARLETLEAQNRTLESTVEALALRLDDHGHTIATVEANLAAEARLRAELAKEHTDQVPKDDNTPSEHAVRLLEEEMATVKADLEREMKTVKADLEEGTKNVKDDLKQDVKAVKDDLETVKAAQIDESVSAYRALEEPVEQQLFCRFVALFTASVDALLGLDTGLLAKGKSSGPDLRSKSRKATEFGLRVAKVAVGVAPGGGFMAGALGFGLNMVTGFLRGSDKAQWSRAMANLHGHWPVDETARGKDARKTAALLVREWRVSGLKESALESFVRAAVDSCLLRLMKEYPESEDPDVIMAGALRERLGPGVEEDVLEIYTSEKERQGDPSGHVMADIMAGGKQVTAHKVQSSFNMISKLQERLAEVEAALAKAPTTEK